MPGREDGHEQAKRELRAVWVGATVFWLAWVSGPLGATLLFGIQQIAHLVEQQRAHHVGISGRARRAVVDCIGRVAGNRDGGMPPWKQKNLNAQARGWTPPALSRAIRAVAKADADLKGASSDASYTLERLVLTIASLRETG